MAREGENTHPPSYTTQVPVERTNKSLKRETQAFPDTSSSSAIKPGLRYSKAQRNTGRKS